MATKKITLEEFRDLVKKTPDSELESVLNIAETNMEILVGTVDPAQVEPVKQKFYDFFKNSPDWEDYKQYWIDQSKNGPTPDDKYIASVRAEQEHFKYKKGQIAISISTNQNTFGKEGDFGADLSFYSTGEGNNDEKRRIIADTLCDLTRFSQANNLKHVVKHSLSIYTGERGALVAWDPEKS
jgi:hypothetical protein